MVWQATAYRAAQSLGLPARPRGRPAKACREKIKAMWLAGVVTHEIAAVTCVSVKAVAYNVKAMGLPKRESGRSGLQKGNIDRYEYALRELQKRLAQAAAKEQAAMINAEMVDGVAGGGHLVGHSFARSA
jgi:hypothetical protein